MKKLFHSLTVGGAYRKQKYRSYPGFYGTYREEISQT